MGARLFFALLGVAHFAACIGGTEGLDASAADAGFSAPDRGTFADTGAPLDADPPDLAITDAGQLDVSSVPDALPIDTGIQIDSGCIAEPPAQWTQVSSAAIARSVHAIEVLQDGRALVVGGFQGADTAEIFDPATNQLRETGRLQLPRTLPRLARLPNGNVLVMGTRLDTEAFDPITERWSLTSPPSLVRNNMSLTKLLDGRVVAIGGSNDLQITGTVEIFDPLANGWAPANASLPRGLIFHGSTLLEDGRIFLAGGRGINEAPRDETWFYFPDQDRFEAGPPLLNARAGADVTKLLDGRVLIQGGVALDSAFARSTEIFDPSTNTISPAASISVARTQPTTTMLCDGKVLIAGGLTLRPNPPQSEIYDPRIDRWSSAPALVPGRFQHAAVLLPDGRVLVTSGLDFRTRQERNDAWVLGP